MTQNRRAPATPTRTSEDYEWVNSWAEASGLNAARQFAAQPVNAASPAAQPPRGAPVATTAAPALVPTSAGAADQLARDIAEIEQARDAIIAAEAKLFVLPGLQWRAPAATGVVRRRDVAPVLIGATLAVVALVVYCAVASIAALGR